MVLDDFPVDDRRERHHQQRCADREKAREEEVATEGARKRAPRHYENHLGDRADDDESQRCVVEADLAQDKRRTIADHRGNHQDGDHVTREQEDTDVLHFVPFGGALLAHLTELELAPKLCILY